MDHDYIEQFDLIDRYLTAKLSADESARFEEHFLECPQCSERLKTTGEFIEGLRSMAVDQVSQAEGQREGAPVRHFFQTRSGKQLALAAFCLLAAAIAIVVVLVVRMSSLQSEVNQAKNETALLERRHSEQINSSPDKYSQAKEQELTERIRELEEKLQSEQQQSNTAGEAGLWKQPQVNLPIFILTSVTRSDPARAESANEIILSRSATSLVIALSLEDDTKYEDYQVSIRDINDRLIWKRRGLKPVRDDYLSIGFAPSFFEAGNYIVTVEGVTSEGDLRPVGSYPVRVVKNS